MDKVLLELIIAIREIKEILAMHNEEIGKLKELMSKPEEKESVEERLVKLALEGSKNLYVQTLENKLEKRIKELETAVKELTEKIEKSRELESEVAEEHLNRLRKALAE